MWWLLALSSATAAQPRITAMSLEPTACGAYALKVETQGRRRAVLLTDDELVSRWRPSNKPVYETTGKGRPGDVVTYTVRAGRDEEQRSLTIPPYELTAVPRVTYFAAGRETHRVVVDFLDPCGALSSNPVTLVIGGKTLDERLFFERIEADIPGQPVGEHSLAIAVFDRKGGTLLTTEVTITVTDKPLDKDGDGFLPPNAGGSDCDDTNSAVHPRAFEGLLANGLDDNCDGMVDEGTTAVDDDGDGISEDDGDCDDTNPAIYPGAVEVWDCQDQDCDGEVDEGVDKTSPPSDRYEPNNSPETAVDLLTDKMRYFKIPLDLWVNGTGDPEYFRFYSHDGLLDSWAITATAERLGVGAAYDVTISSEARTSTATFKGSKRALNMSGTAGGDDSGTYLLEVRSRTEQACPLSLKLVSR